MVSVASILQFLPFAMLLLLTLGMYKVQRLGDIQQHNFRNKSRSAGLILETRNGDFLNLPSFLKREK